MTVVDGVEHVDIVDADGANEDLFELIDRNLLFAPLGLEPRSARG